MLKEMTDKEFTDSLVRKVAELELDLELARSDVVDLKGCVMDLTVKLNSRALKVASRIRKEFLDYEESDDSDANYTLLMKALSRQVQANNKAN